MPIEIHTQDDRLLPGFGVWVKLEMEIHKNVWTVPSEALHFRKGKAFLRK